MTTAEREKLTRIPSGIDNTEILRFVRSVNNQKHKAYFSTLKALTHSEDREISEWLNISEKTFRKYKEASSNTTKPALFEHLIMLISLFKHGIEIFGDAAQFKKWLNTVNFYFDKKPPIEFIYTASGIKYIDDQLTGIEYGDNA